MLDVGSRSATADHVHIYGIRSLNKEEVYFVVKKNTLIYATYKIGDRAGQILKLL